MDYRYVFPLATLSAFTVVVCLPLLAEWVIEQMKDKK